MEYQLIGTGSIVLTWVGLLFIIWMWPGNPKMSYSHHAAKTEVSQALYLYLFAIVLPLFYLFVEGWLVPQFELPMLFRQILLVGMAGQIIAILVPAVSGYKERIHNFGAYLMAFSMIPLMALIALADAAAMAIRVAAAASALYMTIVVLLYFFRSTKLQRNYLYFQSVYIALFHATILAATYTV